MGSKKDHSEPFSSVDAAWLHMDTPTNLVVINGVMTFDRPLDFERLKVTVEARMLTFDRFRQRVREPENRLGLPHWEFDPDFHIDRHLLRDRLPDPGDLQVLQELMSRLVSLPLDSTRPLWQLVYLENFGQGSALIGRLHHCIADGIALMQVLLSLADESPDAPWPSLPEQHKQEINLSPLARLVYPAVKTVKTANRNWRAASHLAHEGIETMFTPSRLAEAATYGKKSAMALGKLLLIPPDPKTLYKQNCGIEKKVAWSKTIKVDEVKAVGYKMGGTINDILLSAMTGALRRYMENRGEPVEGVNIRTMIPVNLRRPEEANTLGNRFGLVYLALPIGIRDPLERLVILKKRMDMIKDTPEAIVAYSILGVMGYTPVQLEHLLASIFSIKGTAIMTNVPGPRQAVYLAGEPIDTFIFWVPTAVNIGLGLSIFSYNGDVIIGFATDAGLVPDPEQIIVDFQDEFEMLKRWGTPPDHPEYPGFEQATLVEMCQALTRSGAPCKNRALQGSSYCRVHQPHDD